MVYLVGMTGQAGIRPGLYGHLSGLPPTNPTRGGMDVVRSGGSCTTASGWVVVDQVTITGTSLTSVDLRFEHRCNGAAAALRGQVHVSLPG
jgi:hypothetical protein